MRKTSDRKTLALMAAVTAGLAALYGAITALIVWLAGGTVPFLYGGLAAGGTAALVIFVLVSSWGIFVSESEDDHSIKPLGIFRIILLAIACLICLILAVPLVILSFGQLGRWLSRESTDEKETGNKKDDG